MKSWGDSGPSSVPAATVVTKAVAVESGSITDNFDEPEPSPTQQQQQQQPEKAGFGRRAATGRPAAGATKSDSKQTYRHTAVRTPRLTLFRIRCRHDLSWPSHTMASITVVVVLFVVLVFPLSLAMFSFCALSPLFLLPLSLFPFLLLPVAPPAAGTSTTPT